MPDSTRQVSPLTESPYTAAQRAVAEAHDEKAEMRKRHDEEANAAQRKIDEAVDLLHHLKAGTEPGTKALAESVIWVRRPERYETEDGPGALQGAIRDLLNGCEQLRERTFGCKHYAGWPGQRCDMQYNYGPKHGTMTFQIGLKDEPRQRLSEGGELTEAEIEAAVQYLTNLPAYVENGGVGQEWRDDVRF